MKYFLRLLKNLDKSILLIVGVLSVISLTMISSTAYSGGFVINRDIIIQALAYFLGFIAIIFLIFLDYKLFPQFEKIIYALSVIFLLTVYIPGLGKEQYGARSWIEIKGITTLQPSEFVKIIFVFFIAGMLSKSAEFGHLILSAVFAGLYVIVLVISTDLGSALIFFMMYLFMVYVGTKKVRYLFIGMAGISTASVIAYKLFSHVQVRVLVWKNPFADDIINNSGYQVSQSLFALGSGGLMGTGLYKGYPNKIPIVDNDFVFSAIGEEFGAIFGILLILVCLSCFISFLNTAMEQNSMFNRLVCVGLGVGYAIQIILTVGGAINMIPSTGVTLPLISSGGSSILSTLIVFAIIQGLAIVGTANMNSVRRKVPTEGTGNVTTRTTSNVKGLRKTQEIQVGTKRKTKIK